MFGHDPHQPTLEELPKPTPGSPVLHKDPGPPHPQTDYDPHPERTSALADELGFTQPKLEELDKPTPGVAPLHKDPNPPHPVYEPAEHELGQLNGVREMMGLPAIEHKDPTLVHSSPNHQALNRQLLHGLVAGGLGAGALGFGATALSRMGGGPNLSLPPDEVEVGLPVKKSAEAVRVMSPKWWLGHAAKSIGEHPLLIPGAAAAGLGGLYGGSALAHYIMDKRRKSRENAELQSAQQDYSQALMSQYNPTKAAEVDAALEKLANAFLPMGVGIGATAGGLLALLAAKGAHNWSRGRSQDELLASAIKHKGYLEAMQNPPTVHVTPTAAEGEKV